MFYCFIQNNSGGSFYGPKYIFIEANNCVRANELAVEKANIYFDGCDKNMDCDCCGDRWYRVSEYHGNEDPMLYDKLVFDLKVSKPKYITWDHGEVRIYYLDNSKEEFMIKV